MKTINRSKKYLVHPNDVDIRGWKFAINEIELGQINDLIIDEDKLKVAFVEVKDKARDSKRTRYFWLPMDHIKFNHLDKQVHLDRFYDHFMDEYPTYSDHIPDGYTVRVKQYYTDYISNYKINDTTNYNQLNNEVEKFDPNTRYIERKKPKEINDNPLFVDKRDHPISWKELTRELERKKQIRKMEYERDIALLEKEIFELQSRASRS